MIGHHKTLGTYCVQQMLGFMFETSIRSRGDEGIFGECDE